MKRNFANLFVPSAVAICMAVIAARAQAVTVNINRNIETNGTNRPFFNQAAFPTHANESGYIGTATPGMDNSSTVANADVGVGGNNTISVPNNNGVPLGVGVTFGASFTVQTVDPDHLLTDAGNAGLGLDSSATMTDLQTARLNAGEKLFFSDITLTPFTVHDPLGQLVPGSVTIGNPRWRSLRSNTNMAPNSPTVTVSSDVDQTQGVFTFAPSGAQGVILNDTPGVFPSITPLYVDTLSGNNWPLKGIGYQVEINYELAPTPATRRTFQFGDPNVTYDGALMHQITDNDTTIMIESVGDAGAVLDTNNLGVGVNSTEDDFTNGIATPNANQRFIDGSLTTPESIHFSFDEDVSFESLTLGNLDLDGTEGVVLSFISGTNPFTGLSGYSGDYTLGADSLTFNTNTGGQTPYAITYGKNGQDELLIEADTVLSLTSNPVTANGFILDMITVHSLADPGLDGDYNGDGTVDAADYVVWRRNDGTPGGYDTWRENFGATLPGSGGGSAVPEPASLALMLVGLIAIGGYSRRAA